MSSSSLDLSMAERYQASWEAAHAETIRGAIRDIHDAIEDALARLEAAGWPGGVVRPIVDSYKKRRQWVGVVATSYYEQQTHGRTVWEVPDQMYLYIGTDKGLYTDEPAYDYPGKGGRQLTGLRALSDDHIAEMIKEWDVTQINNLINAISTGKTQRVAGDPELPVRISERLRVS